MTAIPLPTLQRRENPRNLWFGGSMPIARLGVIINLVVPGAILIWDAFQHQLGVNSANFAIKTTGLIAVTYLLLSLVISPVVLITRWNWLVQFRRAIGCYAFYYAAAHLGIYFWWDREGSLSSTFSEITSRWYLTVGFTSLVCMLPLTLTSFNAAIRKMGGANWKLLHRLAYVAAALAVTHYYMQSKADKSKPDIYIGILIALLLWRTVAALTHQHSKATAASNARFWKGELTLLEMRRETDSVRTFRLGTPDGSPIPFSFKAGQFLSLTIPIDGKRVIRSYTIASSPSQKQYIELTIKREEMGQVSCHLHDKLMHGQTFDISAPAGRFTFEPSNDTSGDAGITLIAGGVGITPSMSILRELTDQKWAGRIDLIFVVRTPSDVIYAEELQTRGSENSNLRVHLFVTRDATDAWTGHRGRPTTELIRQLIPDIATRPAYICGPTAMADSVREQLISLGVPANRITIESFTPTPVASKPASGSADVATALVTFARSGQTVEVPPHQTILEAAEAVGVPIEFQCRSGVCGTCRCRLVSGSVQMDTRDALSDEEEKEGYILACQAVALGDVTIDS